MDMSPIHSKVVFQVEGGSYSSWPSSCMLKAENFGAGKLVLNPCGFALPHYADSSKVGYVLQGHGMAGLLQPHVPRERVVELKKGTAIAVPCGTTSWWYNNGESELVIVFLGSTSTAKVPGEINYFFLTGAMGIFSSFSVELAAKPFGLCREEAEELFKQQTGLLIVKLKDKINGMKPHKHDSEGMVFELEGSKRDMSAATAGGGIIIMPGSRWPAQGEIGLSTILGKLDPDAVFSPTFSPTAATIVYIAGGGGHVEVIGLNAERVLDVDVTEGCVFIVPRFFVMSMIAGGEGMEWFSVVAAPEAVLANLTGKSSILKAISPQVLAAALNATTDLGKLFV